MKKVLTIFLLLITNTVLRSEDGYDLWLRYRPVGDTKLLDYYRHNATQVVVENNSRILNSVKKELIRGLSDLLNISISTHNTVTLDGAVVAGPAQTSALIKNLHWDEELTELGEEGYLIRSVQIAGKQCTVITSLSDVGTLYGTFNFLSRIQKCQSVNNLDIKDRPVNKLRLLNHWDNLKGTIERGYAGKSLWRWNELPEKKDSQYYDYSRACASIGINGTVINNVNAQPEILTSSYIAKVAELAAVFREYGIKTFISVNFAAPKVVGGLNTADPLDDHVRRWWKDKVKEIYQCIPDFGGFLVKANSEGQPGPIDYGRTHTDGANCFAEALLPYNGIVIWRAFVYGKITDRARAAFDIFYPLDGKFDKNVLLQIKNGPMDFQIREPISPLIGKMPNTNLMLELQITQEYTGQATHLCYLVPQWKEVFEFDTMAKGKGTTVSKIIAGAVDNYQYSGIAGVANTGADRNWCGHHLAQANWYGYGRLAWNPNLSVEEITTDWIKMTFGNDPTVVNTISSMLLNSWKTYEKYTSPLGVGLMCGADHYNPGPTHRQNYHHADKSGVGYNRTRTNGSGYVDQYHKPVSDVYNSLTFCPEELLLFFHYFPYLHKLKSGDTVIQHIYKTHVDGVQEVENLYIVWTGLKDKIDEDRYRAVLDKLNQQLAHSQHWRDTVNSYFQNLSGIPIEK